RRRVEDGAQRPHLVGRDVAAVGAERDDDTGHLAPAERHAHAVSGAGVERLGDAVGERRVDRQLQRDFDEPTGHPTSDRYGSQRNRRSPSISTPSASKPTFAPSGSGPASRPPTSRRSPTTTRSPRTRSKSSSGKSVAATAVRISRSPVRYRAGTPGSTATWIARSSSRISSSNLPSFATTSVRTVLEGAGAAREHPAAAHSAEATTSRARRRASMAAGIIA